MPSDADAVYWDASVFLSYINGIDERLPAIDTLLERSRSGRLTIFTSVLSITEVAFSADERANRNLDPEVEKSIDDLFNDRQIVTIAEFHRLIAVSARQLIRRAAGSGLSLKPADAIHLATAGNIRVNEVHTYDRKWSEYGSLANLHVREPFTEAPRLFD